MPLVTPNAQDSPTYQAQAVVDKTDLTALANIAQNYGVVTGCTVSPGGGYNVNVAGGVISTLITDVNVTTVTALAPLAASANDRRDIVVASTAGVVSIISGTPTAETAVPWTNTSIYDPPVKPTLPVGSVLLAEIYIPGGGGTIVNGWITDKTLTSYQSQVPNSSRLIDWGHSWVSPTTLPYNANNYGASQFPGTVGLTDNNQWPAALRDALGIGAAGQNYKTYVVPAVAAAAATTQTFLDFMPEDGTIEAVWYVPTAAVTGQNTNYRSVSINTAYWFNGSLLSLGTYSFVSGKNGSIGQPINVWNINGSVLPTTINSAGSPYTAALAASLAVPAGPMIPAGIWWSSAATGTGLADPGGVVIVRYGTRYRNYGVGGATLLASTTSYPFGSWLTAFNYSPWPRPNATEINTTAVATAGATLISCSALQTNIGASNVITFNGGQTATLTSGYTAGTTSIAVSALAVTIPVNSQGHVAAGSSGVVGSYESLSPTGINVWSHGVNDADATTQDVPAWTETVRACIARNCCSNINFPYTSGVGGNFAYTNGGGAWTAIVPPVGGMLPTAPTDLGGTSNYVALWTGTISSSPLVTIAVGPAFEGGVLDVFLMAVAGTGYGVAGTLTVDGATPPQGTVTFNTGSVSTSGVNVRTVAGTVATASNTTLTGTTTDFSVADKGMIITGTNIPAGTIITAVASATSVTISQATTGTGSGFTMTTRGYYPMVKRLTGIPAGAHTVTLTITASDSVANSALVLYGMGLETKSPTTPVLWCNIARVPAQTAPQKTNSVAYNAASAAVIKGTATAISGNTTEPALGANVQYVDIDTPFGGASPNAAYFLPDGIHPNSAGHRLMARTLFSAIRNNFTPDQLMAR